MPRRIRDSGATAYDGEVFAASIITVDSVEAAQALTDQWPEFPYGGSIDLLPERVR